MELLPQSVRIMIIEDDPVSGLVLNQLLLKMSYNNITSFNDGKLGMEAIKTLNPDVLFLDIKLKGNFSGLDILKYIEATKLHIHVIVTTSYANYAKYVVRYSPIDFLLKPISKEELNISLNKVFEHMKIHNGQIISTNGEGKFDLISINSSAMVNFYHPENIVYLEADGSYTHIFLTNGVKDTISKNLGKIENLLPVSKFVRIGRKNIVNKFYIKKLNKKNKELILEFNNNQVEITISKHFTTTFSSLD